MGGCQNYGPFLATLNNRCRTIMGTQKGTLILTTTHIGLGCIGFYGFPGLHSLFDSMIGWGQDLAFQRFGAIMLSPQEVAFPDLEPLPG